MTQRRVIPGAFKRVCARLPHGRSKMRSAGGCLQDAGGATCNCLGTSHLLRPIERLRLRGSKLQPLTTAADQDRQRGVCTARRTVRLSRVECETLRGANHQVRPLGAGCAEIDQRHADGALVVVQLGDARSRRRRRVDGAHTAGPLPGGALEAAELRLCRRPVVVQLRALLLRQRPRHEPDCRVKSHHC